MGSQWAASEASGAREAASERAPTTVSSARPCERVRAGPPDAVQARAKPFGTIWAMARRRHLGQCSGAAFACLFLLVDSNCAKAEEVQRQQQQCVARCCCCPGELLKTVGAFIALPRTGCVPMSASESEGESVPMSGQESSLPVSLPQFPSRAQSLGRPPQSTVAAR